MKERTRVIRAKQAELLEQLEPWAAQHGLVIPLLNELVVTISVRKKKTSEKKSFRRIRTQYLLRQLTTAELGKIEDAFRSHWLLPLVSAMVLQGNPEYTETTFNRDVFDVSGIEFPEDFHYGRAMAIINVRLGAYPFRMAYGPGGTGAGIFRFYYKCDELW